MPGAERASPAGHRSPASGRPAGATQAKGGRPTSLEKFMDPSSALRAMAARAADPDAAARGLERYWSAASPEIRHRLQHETRLGAALVMVASASQFLTEALIQSPELLLWADAVRRQGGRAREDWSAGLAA